MSRCSSSGMLSFPAFPIHKTPWQNEQKGAPIHTMLATRHLISQWRKKCSRAYARWLFGRYGPSLRGRRTVYEATSYSGSGQEGCTVCSVPGIESACHAWCNGSQPSLATSLLRLSPPSARNSGCNTSPSHRYIMGVHGAHDERVINGNTAFSKPSSTTR
jgi:hypothetical protein